MFIGNLHIGKESDHTTNIGRYCLDTFMKGEVELLFSLSLLKIVDKFVQYVKDLAIMCSIVKFGVSCFLSHIALVGFQQNNLRLNAFFVCCSRFVKVKMNMRIS